MKPRHCTAEDTATHEVWEVDGNSLVEVIQDSAEFLSRFPADHDIVAEHHFDNGEDPYEVILFTVAK